MIRTGYSFKTAVGHLPEVLARIKEVGLPKAPIADRLSTFGFVRWTKLCKRAEIDPVYGVELACVPVLGVKKTPVDYWTFLAEENIAALHELIWTATRNPDKEPALTYAQALSAQGVFKISGERLLIDALPGAHVPRDGFYFGLSPATSRGLYNAAKAAGLPMVAMNANNYTKPEDREFYRVAIGWRSGGQSYPQHILSDEEWTAATARIADAYQQTQAIALRNGILNTCNAKLPKATMLVPEKPKTLRQMCIEGADDLGCDLTRPEYAARLERELDMIAAKQFEDYFYIVADLVQYAKTQMVVGPGRGSSAGSLVCYLLKITAVDPIPFGLLFERFIDVTRNDLPDIDIDFSDERRHLVFEYAERKYGAERIARLGTVGTFKPKAALNQASMELKVPKWRVEKLTDSLILRSSGDSRANQQLEDTLDSTAAGIELMKHAPEMRIATRLEAHPTNASQHAAGLLMTERPVREYVAVDARTKAAMCDKKDAEDLNLLKVDALGLKQLGIFERTLELLGKPQRADWLESLPLNDPAAFEVLNRGHFSGIFQFTGRALKNLVRQSGIESFDDMVAITALGRPGPMGTGGAGAWARRRAGKEQITYPHPLLEPYLNETLGQMVYQEQIMKIGKELGDLTWDDVTQMRKAMSKSLGAEFFDQFGNKWKANVIAKGLPADIAHSFWADLCAFGLYGFNKSHAVAYAIVSYWCCYLKAHHPLEFAAATLDSESEPAVQLEMLRELEAEGVQYQAVDPLHSTARWTPVYGSNTRKLVGPLTNVKGIGPAAVQEILKARRLGEPLRPAIERKLLTAKTPLDSLYPVRDRIRELTAKPEIAAKLVTTPMQVKDIQCGVPGEVVLIAVVSKIAPRDENEAVNVAKRGGRVYTDGKYQSLNLFFKDDTGEIFAKINRYDWEYLGAQAVIDRGRAGTAVYVIKGPVPPDFRMIRITKILYIGDMDQSVSTDEQGGRSDTGTGNEGLNVSEAAE